MKKKLGPFIENMGEAGAACLITMVQGNVLALTLSHWMIAWQTGLFAGGATAAAILIARINKPWVISLVLGTITAIVDFFVHEGAFGFAFVEAALTGLGAAILSLLVGLFLRRLRDRRIASSESGV